MSPSDDSITISAVATTAPGVLLREARERAGLSQDDIAGKLKLAPRQIAAIEVGDWNALPERTFTRGFMRSYARIVGLDPDIVGLDRSPSQPNVGSDLKPTPEAIGEVTLEHDRGRTSAARWAVPLVLIAVLAAGVAYFQWGELMGFSSLKFPSLASGSGATKANAPAPAKANTNTASAAEVTAAPAAAVPDATSSPQSSGSVISPSPAASSDGKDVGSITPMTQSAPSLAPTDATPAAPGLLPASAGEKRISITFKGKSWTEVRSKGDVIYSESSLPGTKEFNGLPPLSFIVGNASNVVLTIDGKPYDMSALTRNDVARFRIE